MSSSLIMSIESLFCAHYWVIRREFKLIPSFGIILIVLKRIHLKVPRSSSCFISKVQCLCVYVCNMYMLWKPVINLRFFFFFFFGKGEAVPLS